jgi:lysophospholipase L1-like esterase
MKTLQRVLCPVGVAGLIFSLASLASAQDHWVATWASAQQQPRGPGAGGRGPAIAAPSIAATPSAPPRFTGSFNNQTVRMVVRASVGGSRVRVHLSNAFGTTPLVIGAAHVALRGKDSAIVAGSDHALAFNGKGSVTIPPGAEMLSDPVALTVAPLGEVAVSVYAPGDTGPASAHSMALRTTWISKEGDFTAAPEFSDAATGAATSQAWYWVSALDVAAPADAGTIVAFGDSITDGATSSPNTDRSWPSVLAQRLQANPATANVAVVNEGISGNRILGDGAGVSALARFDRDVLGHPGVKWLMILEGINDMNIAARAPAGTPPLTADDLIGAMKQMIDRAHAHGIKVIGCTLTPFGNATDGVEAMRQALNAYIRSGGAFDSVVDFDKVIQDPANPRQFRDGYNNTDKLHPNDAGYKAMADAVDLSIFASKPAAGSARR